MAVIAVVLAIVLSNKVRSDVVSDLVGEAVSTSSGRLLSAIAPADLEAPMTGERYDEFHQFVQQAIVSERTARVKIRAKNGTIIYADDPGIVGNEIPPNDTLLKALRGETVAVLKVPNDPTHAAEAQLGHLMEVVTPIIFPGTTEPQGAFAVYQYYEPTAQRIDSLRNWVFGSIGIGFMVLYGSLVCIAWRGWRTITRQRVQLQAANAELGTSLEELREFNRSNQELQQFASIAAHDLQEPLRKVEAFGDRLEAKCGDLLPEQGRDYLNRMRNAAGRMRSLIDDMLAYSRVTTQGEPFTPVDLNQVTREVLSDLEVRIEQVGGRVEVDDLQTIDADPTQIRQLFQNLIGNALKFHRPEEPPVVKIHGQLLNGHSNGLYGSDPTNEIYEIMVEDNGIGFEEKYKDRLFTIFQRLHGRGEYEGNGVGLAVCRKIAERHGGNITAKGAQGEGAKFMVTLPRNHSRGVNAE